MIFLVRFRVLFYGSVPLRYGRTKIGQKKNAIPATVSYIEIVNVDNGDAVMMMTIITTPPFRSCPVLSVCIMTVSRISSNDNVLKIASRLYVLLHPFYIIVVVTSRCVFWVDE